MAGGQELLEFLRLILKYLAVGIQEFAALNLVAYSTAVYDERSFHSVGDNLWHLPSCYCCHCACAGY